VSRRASLIAAVLLLAGPSTAFATRTDAIILRNGDHLTGEVIQMRQGKLEVKTDDAGTISVEWDKIASISTADQYDVTMRDGTHRLGRFRPGLVPDLQLVDTSGVASPVPMAEIASFDRIQKHFFQRIDGSVDFGGSYTKSSGVADLYFDASAQYRRPSYSYNVSFATNLTRQPDQPETSRYSLNTSYTRFRNSGWFVSPLALFESNRELGFTFRGTGAGTIGRYLARTRHSEVVAAGGLSAGRESPVDSDQVTNVDALLTAALSVFTYDYPTTRIDIGVLIFPSLDDPGRVRVNANAKVKREIFRDVTVSLTSYDAFDSRPKSAAATQNDFGASLSFGWTF
jgi:Protein of unknown function, DUF481